MASHIVEEHLNGRRCGFAGLHLIKEAETKAIDGAPRVFKVHGKDPAITSLLGSDTRIVYSYRDIRDVAVSIMKKVPMSFKRLIELRTLHQMIDADKFWRSRQGVLIQRYDQIMANPLGCISEIADHLAVTLSDAHLQDLAAKYSLEETKTRCRAIEDALKTSGFDLQNPETATRHRDFFSELHWNHISSAASGRWQTELSADESNTLNHTFRGWLDANGYSMREATESGGQPV